MDFGDGMAYSYGRLSVGIGGEAFSHSPNDRDDGMACPDSFV